MQKGQKGSESYSLALSGEREFFFLRKYIV